ncbi:MAG: hypothetical protein V7L00_23395 [Nostoc sp.]|nr:hypothetical protein [Nostoc sp. JL33]MBN3872581.1 hypothetical protein [Nostoc sp. JL33]
MNILLKQELKTFLAKGFGTLVEVMGDLDSTPVIPYRTDVILRGEDAD